MQHQYWVTKKSVLRKLGGKEDDCIVSSDAELDAKLELFKCINDSCIQLQRVIDLYQERLCYLAQEENALGRYLKECGKNEKNASAGHIMSTAGKALAYTGHQRLTIRPPLVRLHHEVETFRGRGVTDTRVTVTEMEKARTEYRAALSWMKSASAQLDPDTGHGLEKFRKAQTYVKTSKTKFDRYTLACLQKVDLLAAARCNMFSHALIPYQSAVSTFSGKAAETLSNAAAKLDKIEPYDFNIISELATPASADKQVDKDKNTFFNADYSDKELINKDSKSEGTSDATRLEDDSNISNLLGEDFLLQKSEPEPDSSAPSSALLDLVWPSNNNMGASSDFLGGDFMPSRLLQEGTCFFGTDYDLSSKLENVAPSTNNTELLSKETPTQKSKQDTNSKRGSKDKTAAQVSWLSLFAELDPLANQDMDNSSNDRA